MQDKNKTGGHPLAVLALAAVLAAALVVRRDAPRIASGLSAALSVARVALVVMLAALAAWLIWRVIIFSRAPRAAKLNYWRTFVARHRWRHLARNLGLAHADPGGRRKFRGLAIGPAVAVEESKGHIRYPRTTFRADSWGIRAEVWTIPKCGRAELEKASDALADEWRVSRVQVSQPRPGKVILRGLVRDPLAFPFGPEGTPPGTYEHPEVSRPYLGLSEHAEHRYLSLPGQTGIVIGGLPGRGKSSLLGSLLCQWGPSPAVQLGILDGKGSHDHADWLPRAWLHSGDDLAAAVELLEDFHLLLRRRLSCVVEVTGRKNSWHAGPSAAWPLVILLVDECQQFLDVASYKGDKDREALARRCVALIAELIRKGRSAMIVCVLATQKCTSDSVPTNLRDNCGIGLAFGVRTVEAAAAVLGAEIREFPSVSPVGLQGDEFVGCLTSSLRTGQDVFTRIRVPGFTEEEISKRAAAAVQYRADPLALLTASPAPSSLPVPLPAAEVLPLPAERVA